MDYFEPKWANLHNERGQEAYEVYICNFCEKDLVEEEWNIVDPKVLLEDSIGVLRNIAIFTGKYLCWKLFLINLQGVCCEYCGILTNKFVYRAPPVAAFVSLIK